MSFKMQNQVISEGEISILICMLTSTIKLMLHYQIPSLIKQSQQISNGKRACYIVMPIGNISRSKVNLVLKLKMLCPASVLARTKRLNLFDPIACTMLTLNIC